MITIQRIIVISPAVDINVVDKAVVPCIAISVIAAVGKPLLPALTPIVVVVVVVVVAVIGIVSIGISSQGSTRTD